MAHVDYLKLKQKLEQSLARYDLSGVVEEFRELDLMAIPISLAPAFASIARQAQLYKEAIVILQGFVYGTSQPSPEILLEYASSLRRLGLVNQCLQLLQRVPDRAEKSLHEAYCYIHMWNYADAKVSLEHFLSLEPVSERDTVVAKLNLSSCYIYLEDFEQAAKLLKKIEPLCEKSYQQYHLNILEMRGQIHIAKKETAKALAVLKRASSLAQTQTGNTTLFIQKWKLVAEALKGDPQVRIKFTEFKKTIRDQTHWESLRDLDYQFAVIQNDPKLLNHVFFGTPFVGFKERIKKNHAKKIQQSYLWCTNSESPVTYTLDGLSTTTSPVAFGLIQHRLLLVLLSDFYRPFSVARIFDSLFPADIYDPHSSPKRVYALVKKLQDAFMKANLPLEIISTVHGYRLRQKAGAVVILYDRMVFETQEQLLHYSLQSKYHLKNFTPTELAQTLNVSSHKAYRWINEMEQQNLVSLDGATERFKIIKAA